ncbi:MAG: sigma 54-interacting transcriptional regulator [Polyangiaceae bacterium]
MSGSDEEFESTRYPAPPSMNMRSVRRIPALTIACHPDASRIGDQLLLSRCAVHGSVEVARLEPEFTATRERRRQAIADSFLSRKPCLRVTGVAAGVLLEAPNRGLDVLVDAEPLEGQLLIDAERLAGGVVIEIARRHVWVLHETHAGSLLPEYGFVGESDAVEQLRAAVEELGPLRIGVLIRGATGSGKELVARALHEASPRRSQPLVAVNMAAVQPTLAASTLFGHVRGAFTGASSDHDGLLKQADGGTLFLDEVGDTPSEIQAMLLRVLETGEVQPLGSPKSFRVDVRLLAATDADLESAVAGGRFRGPLLHRLAESVIRIAPLKARREDIGRLLLHFLRADLADLGASHRLSSGGDQPWLRASVVARLCRYDWPGNVRQLRNLARQLAVAGRSEHKLRLTPSIEAELMSGVSDAGSSGAVESRGDSAAPERRAELRSLDEIDEDELLRVLREHDFKRDGAAKALGISRTSLYELINRSSKIRKSTDLTGDEIRTAISTAGGDLKRVASELGVSQRGLRLRMRELGVSLH